MRILWVTLAFASIAAAQLKINTASVPAATQYQSYNTTLTATGGAPPYSWTIVSSTGTSLPEGMSLSPATGVISAAQVNGQGGYAVTIQVADSSSPNPAVAFATLNFAVNSDSSYGGCQMFPPDSVYHQRIDQLPVDTSSAHQIPSSYLTSPIHPDFGTGFYPSPGGIPFVRVPSSQPDIGVYLGGSGQLDAAGTHQWPFPLWPNLPVEGTSYGLGGNDHHALVLETSQTGSCILYETYQSIAVPNMFDAQNNTWNMSAGAHYTLGSNQIAASESTLDTGSQDSTGIPMLPLLIRYSEVPLGVQHPLRMTFPSPTQGFVWPATGCCTGNGPPEGLLYRLKAGVNWQAACPAATNPQAATVLQALQQYGAYMSDHGSSGYISGVPDPRWNDLDLACIKTFHVSDLEVVDNSALEVADVSGQTKPYVIPAALPAATIDAVYSATLRAIGGNPATLQWSIASGSLPPGLTLNALAGTIGGTPLTAAGSPFTFGLVATDTASGYASAAQSFSLAVAGSGLPIPDLTILKSHTGNFRQGDTADTYVITVGNSGGASTSGTVTVTDTVPAGLTLVSMAGTGWSCPSGGSVCMRADVLAPGTNYPPITVTVSVSASAPPSAVNTATVAGGGESNTANDTASDPTTLTPSTYRITTTSVPAATQYQSYSTTLAGTGGVPPYTWSVVSSTGVGLPEGMSLNPSTGVIGASQVNGQGGYAVTVQLADSASPSPSIATTTLNFAVMSDTSYGGCQLFPGDSIYHQRIDQLPVDSNSAHQIPSSWRSAPIHPDFGTGFYPGPGGIPFLRVPVNQPLTNINLQASGQIDLSGTYQWPFLTWPNQLIEGTSDGLNGDDHHILVLQTNQNGPCTLYEAYQSSAVPTMFQAQSNTWNMSAGVHYFLNSNETAASEAQLDSGAQDSSGIPMVPLLIRYSEVPLGVQHPLRVTFPGPTNWFVWPATGCCTGSGPPQGLLYRLKASVNWQAACPVSTNPQAATVLQALQQYGAYMTDHGSAGYISGAPDPRWNDNDLACIKNFHVSDLEVVDNSALEVSDTSGQTMPYVVPVTLPAGQIGVAYNGSLSAVGGNAASRQFSISSGALPPGLTLSPTAGTISGTPLTAAGGPFGFSVTATDTASNAASNPQSFTLVIAGSGLPSPDLTILKSHNGNFRQGDTADTYVITVGNSGGASANGTVSVTESLPTGLTLVSMAGSGWSCPSGGNICTRGDTLVAGANYPAITVTVSVGANASASVINTATVSGGGEFNTGNNVALDPTTVTSSAYRILTTTVPTATQYQSYNTTLTATGGVPPYTWSVVSSTGVSLPEGMSLNPATGAIAAAQVNGQGGYAVTIQLADNATPSPDIATTTLNFAVNSDTSYGGCQMFPADSIYNQRIDRLPVDANPAHQIPSGSLGSALHPDFGTGYNPGPGGIPFLRVPAGQSPIGVSLGGSGQIDPGGAYRWPFLEWPNQLIEGTSNGVNGADHHILVLQTGACTLYETYQSAAVPTIFNTQSDTWNLSAGVHYALNTNEIAASDASLDTGAQDSAGIPMVPLLLRYSEIPLGVQHPLRITFPGPTNWFVWPATGCCKGSGPPQGLLYRLKASVNWQATCPVDANPQAATILQALQQYGAYMSDHGSAGYISGVPDARWSNSDLGCIKNFHVSDLEVVDNSALEVSDTNGQTKPYVVPAAMPAGTAGTAYSTTLPAVGGNPSTRQWSISAGALPPGLGLNASAGTISGTPLTSVGSPFNFSVTATDTSSGNSSAPQSFAIGIGGAAIVVLEILSVTNSASGASGAIAPGELVTIKGNLLGPSMGASYSLVAGSVPDGLAGTQVFIGNLPAPILYASATQINAIVPWEVAGQSQVTVQVRIAGAGSVSYVVPVAAAAPGIFTFNSTGAGPAAATDLSGAYIGTSHPAAPGTYVVIYFTGGGVTLPPGATGSVSGSTLEWLTQNVTATVGNVSATVQFDGAAPDLVSGLNQLNLLLPDNTPIGDAVPVVLTVGTQSTPATATLSVH